MAYASTRGYARAQHGVAGQVGARRHAQADGNVVVLASLLRRDFSCRPGRRN
jgi:hypothetical protein